MNLATKNQTLLSDISTVETNKAVLHELNQLEARDLRSTTFCELDFRSRNSATNHFGQVVEVVMQGVGSGPASGTGVLRPPPLLGLIISAATVIPAIPTVLNTIAITPRVIDFFMSSLHRQDK